MTWHLEPTTLHGRRYVRGSFDDRSRYASIVTIRIVGRTAHLSGMLNDGTQGPISRRDWVELRDKLRAEYGIESVEAERGGEGWARDTGSAPLGPV